MPWFVMQCERKTWTKYIVEAKSNKAAIEADNWKYLGYLDGPDTKRAVVLGPFKSISEARKDGAGYVEGR